ncbi:SDR family oxidoreductase [Pikeienuella piscinae]|uniref:SDR family oxidoreductase n=1 Tax=Pikeienuella piscinae TaxID=2748098 RepID=A0A7L5BT53_9RHOB|nr:SDR family oxidoreductase [Pikeienuella piscinae]QIE55030.1 SDR family oxidoreductase [Pikeienuella piscinae]
MASLDFSGKRVLVAGGTSGINLGVAEGFAKASAAVFVFSRDAAKVGAAVERLSAHGGRAGGGAADVRDMGAVEGVVARAAAEMGGLDVVISGAAGNFLALVNGMSSNAFRTVMEIDLLGTFHVMRAVFPHLTKPGASVVNITAPQSWRAMSGQGHVCAAKAGVDQLTRTLALEWGHHGVRINSVSPGPIADSGGVARLYSDEAALERRRASIPLERLGSNEDIANMCLFLASDMAGYVTGALIPVDGGAGLTMEAMRLDPRIGARGGNA